MTNYEIKEQEIREWVKTMPKEKAIKELEKSIFYEEMVDIGYDFKLVAIYKKILKELRGDENA